MAQNINNVQCLFWQNAGHLQAPLGQTYQVPPSSPTGMIGMSRRDPDGGKISTHKRNMGFTAGKPSKDLYNAWRKCVKDEMTARNSVLPNDKPANYTEVDFLSIYIGIRALLPAFDLIATAMAANNQAHIMDLEEAVVDLIKDAVKKLEHTKRRASGVLVNPWLAPTQVILDPTLLHPGAPVL